MRITRYFLIAAILISFNGFALSQVSQDSIKCSSKVLKSISAKLGKLSKEDIRLFLQTFSIDCANNSEFSEWSNELLFKSLNLQPQMLIQGINSISKEKQILIINELKSPINDGIDVKQIRERVRKIIGMSAVKKAVLSSLDEAIKKSKG